MAKLMWVSSNHPVEHISIFLSVSEMNRHHYSMFVHNCRLVFLLRQEPFGNDLNVFKPAEWRWKVPQVCDGQWHHYAVSIDFPQVRIYFNTKTSSRYRNTVIPQCLDLSLKNSPYSASHRDRVTYATAGH